MASVRRVWEDKEQMNNTTNCKNTVIWSTIIEWIWSGSERPLWISFCFHSPRFRSCTYLHWTKVVINLLNPFQISIEKCHLSPFLLLYKCIFSFFEKSLLQGEGKETYLYIQLAQVTLHSKWTPSVHVQLILSLLRIYIGYNLKSNYSVSSVAVCWDI